jgi:hypothetical protein
VARLSGLISLLQSGAIKPIVAKISPVPEAAVMLRVCWVRAAPSAGSSSQFDFAYKKNPIKTRG